MDLGGIGPRNQEELGCLILDHVAHIAALSWRHTEGRAIDMTITRLREILSIKKQEYPTGVAKADANEALWFIGDHLFSVKELASDPPHWSDDGH